jgi:hypothetical protein
VPFPGLSGARHRPVYAHFSQNWGSHSRPDKPGNVSSVPDFPRFPVCYSARVSALLTTTSAKVGRSGHPPFDKTTTGKGMASAVPKGGDWINAPKGATVTELSGLVVVASDLRVRCSLSRRIGKAESLP